MLKFLKLFLFACILSVPGAALLTELVLYSQNSIYLNDRWIAEKRMMKMGLVRGDEYLLTRTPLARNMLDLGRYHGYQEVIYRDLLTLSSLEFDFSIDDASYLDVTYNRDDNGYAGVRLSRRQDMPSFAFESTAQGGFRSRRLIPIQNLEPGWHRAVIRSSGLGLTLVIDRASIDLPTASSPGSGRIGFFAGMNGATIDNVSI